MHSSVVEFGVSCVFDCKIRKLYISQIDSRVLVTGHRNPLFAGERLGEENVGEQLFSYF